MYFLSQKILKSITLQPLLIIGLLFILVGQAQGSDVLIITDEQDIYSIAQHLSILEDSTNKLTLKDIKQSEESWRFKKNKKDNLSIGYSSSTFWLRFNVKNTSKENKAWLIQQNYTNTHKMNIYVEANKFKPQLSGSVLPVAERELLQKEIAFPIKLPINKEQIFYIKLQSFDTISLDINLLTQTIFMKNSSINTLILGLFYGILFILIIYNLAFFLALKDMSNLYLSLFMLFCGASYSLFDGYLQLIMVNATQLSATPFLITMFTGLGVIMLLLHRKSFLVLEKQYINKAHDIQMVLWVIIITLAPFINLVFIHKAINILGIFTISYLIYTSIIGWQQNKPAARFAAVGWMFFCISLLLIILVRLQILPDSFIIDHLLRVAILVIALLLSIALLLRINKLRVFNEKSRDILMYSELQRNLALEAAQLGVWRWQVASDAVYWSNKTCEIYGVKENEVPKGFEAYSKLIHPDDL
ncbi:MAG: hypothetical protein KAT04_14680, partial [Methylococcales bacterium]|nr:hypothetical protein [Methylococcales bacterium]